jgi:predicted nucleotidyltransferase
MELWENMEDDFVEKVKEYLIRKYDCHLIIIYGSYARNEYTKESDVDIICFSDKDNPENDTSMFLGRQLDVWIYNTNKIKETDEYLRIMGGKILLDKNNLGNEFLERINKKYEEGPKKLKEEKKLFLKSWLIKMLNRAKKGDCEGNYRLHWLLIDSLEIYFNLNDKWYLGPQKSLKWLKENDKETFLLYDNALRINGTITDVEKLINHLTR